MCARASLYESMSHVSGRSLMTHGC